MRISVGYERVSSEKQKIKGFSIDDQIEAIEQRAELDHVKIAEHFVDKARSGSNMKRKGIQSLLRRVADGEIERIYIKFANRLTRDDAMIRSLRLVFAKYDVTVISLNDDWAGQEASSDRKLSCDLVSRVDKTEPERAVHRTNAGLAASARMGNYPIGKVPKGFKKIPNPNSKIPDKETIAPIDAWRPAVDIIVSSILEKQMTGESIANHLNSIGMLDRKWTAKEVLYIATKVEYYGGFNEAYYRSDEHHEGFYSKDIHDLLDKVLHGRRREKKYIYLFKGLVFCASCGELLTCIPTVKKSKGKNNIMNKRPILYYYCNNCKKRINEQKLLPEILFDFENRLVVDDQAKQDRIKLYNKLLKIKAEIERIEDDYFEDLISYDYFIEKKENLHEKMKLVESQLADVKENIAEWIDQDRYTKRNSIRNIFGKITIDLDGKIIKSITFRK